jgi:hypothetical protein
MVFMDGTLRLLGPGSFSIPDRSAAGRSGALLTDTFEWSRRRSERTRWRLSPEMSAITDLCAGVPVAGLDALLERLARRTKVPHPEGNAIAFAELPGAG